MTVVSSNLRFLPCSFEGDEGVGEERWDGDAWREGDDGFKGDEGLSGDDGPAGEPDLPAGDPSRLLYNDGEPGRPIGLDIPSFLTLAVCAFLGMTGLAGGAIPFFLSKDAFLSFSSSSPSSSSASESSSSACKKSWIVEQTVSLWLL